MGYLSVGPSSNSGLGGLRRRLNGHRSPHFRDSERVPAGHGFRAVRPFAVNGQSQPNGSHGGRSFGNSSRRGIGCPLGDAASPNVCVFQCWGNSYPQPTARRQIDAKGGDCRACHLYAGSNRQTTVLLHISGASYRASSGVRSPNQNRGKPPTPILVPNRVG